MKKVNVQDLLDGGGEEIDDECGACKHVFNQSIFMRYLNYHVWGGSKSITTARLKGSTYCNTNQSYV